jgi:hypothetical protein
MRNDGSRLVPLAVCLTALLLALPGFAHAQCMDEPTKRVVRRDGTAYSVLDARARLVAYDQLLELAQAYPPIPDVQTLYNCMRGEILTSAMQAYLYAGPVKYPADPAELMAVLDSRTLDQIGLWVWPSSLQELVDCGILPHLPASPYPDGQYLTELPDAPRPGDLYYKAWAPARAHFHPAGSLECGLLVVFDNRTPFNSGRLYTPEQLAATYIGDLTAQFALDRYDMVCLLMGTDVETEE